MGYKKTIKGNIDLTTLPEDYHKFVSSKDYSSTLEAYKHACELSLECGKVDNGMVYLILDNINEIPYLPTFHIYEDDQGNLGFVTEHHVDFTKNIKLCKYRLCLWYIGDRSVNDFKERFKEVLPC